MHGGKLLLLIVVVGLLGATGLFIFVPGVRPGFVQGWFNKAKGYTKAKSAEDALDKFKQAIEKRDYQAASLYVSGDYKEFFEKGSKDALEVGEAIDNLRAAMKTQGVKSDKADLVFFQIDPFPGGFKYKPSGSGDTVTAVFDWSDAVATHKDAATAMQGTPWQVKNLILNSLLPQVVSFTPQMTVTVKKESDGGWRIQLPTSSGDRHVRDTVEYLRKNGSNFRNALVNLKNEVKNDPGTKENFEQSLRTKLEESK